jgi:hypothetical protein
MGKHLKLKRDYGKERPLSTLSEEEYNLLKEMGLLWELYPDATPNYVDLSMAEIRARRQKLFQQKD